jgi:hypothetical protein
MMKDVPNAIRHIQIVYEDFIKQVTQPNKLHGFHIQNMVQNFVAYGLVWHHPFFNTGMQVLNVADCFWRHGIQQIRAFSLFHAFFVKRLFRPFQCNDLATIQNVVGNETDLFCDEDEFDINVVLLEKHVVEIVFLHITVKVF